MSDEDDSDDETNIDKKIQKLQRQKEKLKEKQKHSDKKQLLAKLQQELLNLQESDQSSSSKLKDSAGPSVSSKKSRDDSYNLERKQQQQESDENISEEEEGNQLMSDAHKKRLQENRPYLVENMTPDDIFNVLLSNKVLTSSEVSKIRESSGREATNEELLDTLVRKSDRAFGIFVDALRKSLQDHLADLLQISKRNTKRKAGDINVKVGVEHLQKDKRYRNDSPICSCDELEKQIFIMAKNAYSQIRRKNDSPAAYEQFRKELTGTNTVIKESLEVIKLLCKHDTGIDLENITYSSICFQFHCRTFDGLQELWNMYASGVLLDRLQKGLVTRQLKQRYHLKNIQLRVRMSEEEYQTCVRELLSLNVNGSESTKATRGTRRSKTLPYRIPFKELHHNVSNLNFKVKPSAQPRKIRSTRENCCGIELRSKSVNI